MFRQPFKYYVDTILINSFLAILFIMQIQSNPLEVYELFNARFDRNIHEKFPTTQSPMMVINS